MNSSWLLNPVLYPDGLKYFDKGVPDILEYSNNNTDKEGVNGTTHSSVGRFTILNHLLLYPV